MNPKKNTIKILGKILKITFTLVMAVQVICIPFAGLKASIPNTIMITLIVTMLYGWMSLELWNTEIEKWINAPKNHNHE